MKRIPLTHLAASAALLAGLGLSSAAGAQYVWLDEKGVKQFSDMPPPASVPSRRILKQPGAAAPASASVETNAPAQPKPEMTSAEKNAEFRKRRTEQAEKEKKTAEETRLAQEKNKNCDRARDYRRALESGERISRAGKSGERTFLTDEQRAKELRDTRHMLEDCK